jgi:hypothetical protein
MGHAFIGPRTREFHEDVVRATNAPPVPPMPHMERAGFGFTSGVFTSEFASNPNHHGQPIPESHEE